MATSILVMTNVATRRLFRQQLLFHGFTVAVGGQRNLLAVQLALLLFGDSELRMCHDILSLINKPH